MKKQNNPNNLAAQKEREVTTNYLVERWAGRENLGINPETLGDARIIGQNVSAPRDPTLSEKMQQILETVGGVEAIVGDIAAALTGSDVPDGPRPPLPDGINGVAAVIGTRLAVLLGELRSLRARI